MRAQLKCIRLALPMQPFDRHEARPPYRGALSAAIFQVAINDRFSSRPLDRRCTGRFPMIESCQKSIPQPDARVDALARCIQNLQRATRIIRGRGCENGLCGRTVFITVHLYVAF